MCLYLVDQAVSFCDDNKHWTQLMVLGDRCPKNLSTLEYVPTLHLDKLVYDVQAENSGACFYFPPFLKRTSAWLIVETTLIQVDTLPGTCRQIILEIANERERYREAQCGLPKEMNSALVSGKMR